jgi:hypothetical protein
MKDIGNRKTMAIAPCAFSDAAVEVKARIERRKLKVGEYFRKPRKNGNIPDLTLTDQISRMSAELCRSAIPTYRGRWRGCYRMSSNANDLVNVPRDAILNSWKEIASYLGRGVRTVQRYEQDCALPIRRLPGKPRSSVLALRQELDQWVRNTSVPIPHDDGPPVNQITISQLREQSSHLLLKAAELRCKNRALQESHQRALLELARRVRSLITSVATKARTPDVDSSNLVALNLDSSAKD